ncbi:hypothetical protein [Chitinophaga niabensis]|nr:hypothetical protein [Chitinophaga niabensis]
MKWLLVLFATYMLALPCIPCNAAEVCCLKEDVCAAEEQDCHEDERPCSTEDSCTEEACSHHEHSCPEGTPDKHEHSATCPCCPSFSCNTCHSIIVSSLVLEDPIISACSFDNISFAEKPLANFSAIIWQPPKVL